MSHFSFTSFDPSAIEQAAQTLWKDNDAYRVVEQNSKPKYYACSMLPYPSGKLHMGHVRNYTINDMLARYLRMKGYNVLMPMGWDAFGLPAENAAIKNKVPPAQWTYDNIAYMKKQMQVMGLAIDWSREVATCSPDYYKWNQWLFLKMLEKGIAYRKTQVVNWDPVDQTVLANEQVIDGRGWRTGALVEKREIPGYYLKITDYAQELLDHVQIDNPKATLTGWPERVRLMQENWIGKSEGVRFAFPHHLEDDNGVLIGEGKLYVFTTRADTLMGVTFCAVAPEHPLATFAAKKSSKVREFITNCQQGGTAEAQLALKDKEGVPTGLFVSHPLTHERIEIWVGNYVLMSYGDGAVMGVPAHDERDFAFANKYGIPIVQVISAPADKPFNDKQWQDWYGDKTQGVCINSHMLDGLSHAACVDKVAQILQKKGLGEKKITWRLRDWGISRQRYWGTPIPIVHCDACGVVPVPEKDLPVVLPENCVPDGSGNPLNKHTSFLNVACPCCGKDAKRETDTMDTFVDSSWYFMRYCNAQNRTQMADGATQYWMQGGMDQYIGGIEHAILHLLYARFWTKVMRDLGLVQIDEPFHRLLTQGMVLNHIYSRKTSKGAKDYFWPSDVEPVLDDNHKVIGAQLIRPAGSSDGQLPIGTHIDYEGVGTMSKSKNNGIDPQDLIDRYGADTARLYVMFTAPPEATLEWNDTAVEGSYRYLRRVWNYCLTQQNTIEQGMRTHTSQTLVLSKDAQTLRRSIHSILKQANYDYERMQYNTVVSATMKMLNTLEAFKPSDDINDAAILTECISILLRVLYPVCPHMTYVLWMQLGYGVQCGDLLTARWADTDESALVQDEIELMLQVNGKLRGSIHVASSASEDEIKTQAKTCEAVSKQLQSNAALQIRKVIVVPKRLVNVVLA